MPAIFSFPWEQSLAMFDASSDLCSRLCGFSLRRFPWAAREQAKTDQRQTRPLSNVPQTTSPQECLLDVADPLCNMRASCIMLLLSRNDFI